METNIKKENSGSTKIKLLIGGVSGVLNGMFGSGGGVIAVPLFGKLGIEQKKCHATSVAFIFVLSLCSVIIYGMSGRLDVGTGLRLIPSGLIGALIGSMFLKKINNVILKRIFGVIILISAVRMFMI